MFRGFYHVQWVGGPDLMACLLRQSSPWSSRCCCKLNWKSSFRFFFTYVWRQTFTFSVRGTGCGLYSLLTTSSPAGSKDVYILFTPSLSHADPECPLPSPPYLGFRVPVRRLDPCGPTNVCTELGNADHGVSSGRSPLTAGRSCLHSGLLASGLGPYLHKWIHPPCLAMWYDAASWPLGYRLWLVYIWKWNLWPSPSLPPQPHSDCPIRE